MAQQHFRSIWISDLHLGTRSLKNEQVLDFLLRTDSDYLYLVGDIFDLVQANKAWHWPAVNDRIVQTLLAKAASGTQVVYLPGNHDHMLRSLDGLSIGNIRIQNTAIHQTVDGRRYLVLHGDTFDPVIRHCPWLAKTGSVAYALLLRCNRWFKIRRPGKKHEHRTLSAWLKHQTKRAVNFIGQFDALVAKEVAAHRVDGLICGHIHRAGIREIGSALYTNTGDWVESCTALAENQCGRLGVIEWPTHQPLREAVSVVKHENLYSHRCLASPN
jgi:UDP-2,3-diacylglucosamine pyrophosphatase LpxH